MTQRCLNANGKSESYKDVELRMSESKWLEWAIPRYEKFISENPDESPSVSRFKDQGHYDIDNIEIISLQQNIANKKTFKLYVYLNCDFCGKQYDIEARNYRTKIKIGQQRWFCGRTCRGNGIGFSNNGVTGFGSKTTVIPHGTSSGYSYHKCRCIACKECNTKRNKKYRQ
jgi:hypothetical protein